MLVTASRGQGGELVSVETVLEYVEAVAAILRKAREKMEPQENAPFAGDGVAKPAIQLGWSGDAESILQLGLPAPELPVVI